MNLSAIDLNLLVVLEALLTESSVTRAARRVGLSQPATSNALARLRDVFGDPLFVRTPKGMVATPRAHQLAGPVREALATLQRALSPVAFDPKTATRRFTIAAPDSVELLLGAALVSMAAAQAPNVRIAILPPARHPDLLELLDAERADLAIQRSSPTRPPLRTAPLFTMRLVCLARNDHPSLRSKRLTLATFTSLRHVLVAPYGAPGSIIDDALARMRTARVVALRVSTFSSAAMIAANTDHVTVMPEAIARMFVPFMSLQLLELPFAMPEVPVDHIWHARFEHDDGHRWFRDLVTATAASVTAAAPAARPRRRR